MIYPAEIPTPELSRVIYLAACAISTALRVRGVEHEHLYQAKATSLSLWVGLTRGNLLAMMRILIDSIRESDIRRGSRNERGKVRFLHARRCAKTMLDYSIVVPMGPVYGTPPIKI